MAVSQYQELHEDIRDGPLKNRRCTDVICLFVFVVFFGAMVFFGVIGFQNGNPENLTHFYDSGGNQCGREGTATENFKYVYFLDPSDRDAPTVCVSKCPSSSTEAAECYPNSWVNTCGFNYVTRDKKGTKDIPPYPSKGLFKRICFPDLSSVANTEDNQKIADLQDSSEVQVINWLTDVAHCWTITLAVLGIALFIAIFYLIFLRYFSGCAVWTSMVIILALIVAFGLFLYWTATTKYADEEFKSKRITFISCAIAMWVFGGLVLLMLVCMRDRIELAIAIMKSASLFIKDTWTVLLIPIILFLVTCVFTVFWILAVMYLYSSGDIKQTDRYYFIPAIETDAMLKSAFYVELFGLFWVNWFKVALGEILIAGAVSYWYFDQHRDERDGHYVKKSLKTNFTYHLGSVALGSFILAIVTAIKWILTYIQKRVQQATGGEQNRCLMCCCSCLTCCVHCFERFLQFLDKNAYIRIALSGETFCTAAKNAFLMILENAARFAVIGSIGELFNFLGKLLITFASMLLGYLIITKYEYYNDAISSPIPPTVIFGIVSYLVAALFMSVYSMACDSIIVVFIVDERHHKGDNQFAPEPLKEFMAEHRDKEDSGCC